MRLWRKTTTHEFVQGFFWIDVAEKVCGCKRRKLLRIDFELL
jgi:hypothetical protein